MAGDETPIVPRMYTLPKGKELSQEEAEAKAKARKEEADSDDDSDVFDDDVSDRSYGFGTNQLTPDEDTIASAFIPTRFPQAIMQAT
eukprot:1897830-Amphidinium_carterae.2